VGSGNITLLHVRGIRIGVDYSWFLVLFLIIFWLSGFYRDVTEASDDSIGPYLLALASALLFFASILLHELGHAFVAIRNGIGIRGITLWMFGGIALMERDTDTPGKEFKVAIGGPIVTLLIVIVCSGLGVALAGPDEFRDAALTDSGARTSGTAAVIAWLGSINLLVLLFNLLPAFPLDGGRIARAIAWRVTGDRERATRFAATVGRGFAFLMIAFGVYMALRGDLVGGLWLAVIGFILNGAAKGAIAQSQVTGQLAGLSVGDVMDREPVAIPEGMTVDRALDEYFLRYRYPWFPVVDPSSHFIGLLDQGTIENVDEAERTTTNVAQILARDEGALTVRDDAPLESVLGSDALRRLGALMAIDGDGRLIGVITVSDVGRALRDIAPGPTAAP
jgi:Zn-dependent protease